MIIEEKFKKPSERTIAPVKVGGIAGGEKFIHEGIFFKFCNDDHGIYGGKMEYAMKAAGKLSKKFRYLCRLKTFLKTENY